MNAQVLHTQQLSIGYQHKKDNICVGSDINLTLNSGQLISMVGANGAGKSTLIRTLGGLQKPLSGHIFLENKNLTEFSTTQIAQKLSLVLTEKLPPSQLSVYELVALGRQPYTNWLGDLSQDDTQKIELAIKLTQIDHLRHKKHHEISDGQLQTVMIARALAQDTDLIILDEPSTHLDWLHKISLMQLLKKLSHEAGKCILFSTHDLDMALEYSDQMVVLTAQKCWQNTPDQLIEQGIFSELFPKDQVTFDTTTKKFLIR
ncbi:ABC transporter ATP-binding protein [Flavobacterium sp. CYK-55]|uniref:ABC transporter ATP-binding protein n=1 Tax=Flavobacterium sp. CYK-55 TaxID=2835529 RepID=UPI001BCE1A59|nr:ABC transporter ATP-binding protein [Flavobacterium sp. CYK-55]MBS7787426.1 ABC transporter ATP-binding protein [Flavobacterium sp. CYK-55]